MLKYIIAFSIITFCNSMPSTQYNYNEMILIQRAPVSAFEVLKKQLEARGLTFDQICSYLSTNYEPLMAMDSRRWLIHGLFSLYSNGTFLSKCRDSDGKLREYNSTSLNETFKNELRRYWPSSLLDVNEENAWKGFYNLYGSCINSSPAGYFRNAMNLRNTFNIGQILQNAGILPGERFRYQRVMDAITHALRVRPYIICESALEPGSKHQYLYEISLCLDGHQRLINCVPSRDEPCHTETTVIYPTWGLNRY